MAGLILKLRPHEQLLINGVVIENGERKTKLRICTEGAHILRLRDALKPEDANTPLKRAYYAAQLAVAGELNSAQASILIEQAVADYANGDRDDFRMAVKAHLAAEEFYKVMRLIRDEPEPVLPETRNYEAPRAATG